jgi:hypothetical protein
LLSEEVQHAAAGKGIPHEQARAKSQGFAREIPETLRNWIFCKLRYHQSYNTLGENHGRLCWSFTANLESTRPMNAPWTALANCFTRVAISTKIGTGWKALRRE